MNTIDFPIYFFNYQYIFIIDVCMGFLAFSLSRFLALSFSCLIFILDLFTRMEFETWESFFN